MAAKVNWYGERVQALINDAQERVLDEMAFATEAQAKINIRDNDQIDTGFMLNSVYTLSSRRDGHGRAMAESMMRAPRELAPKPAVKHGEAAVTVGARYAVYQEMKKSFLYRAVEAVAKQFGARIRTVKL